MKQPWWKSGFLIPAVWLMVVTASATAADYQPQTANPSADCTLRVGYNLGYAFKDHNGDVRGLEPDIAREAIQRSGCRVKFVELSYQHQLAGLAAGTLDVVDLASNTAKRRIYAYFSIPYRIEQWALYARTEKAPDYASLNLREALAKGAHIGLISGRYYGKTIERLRLEPFFLSQFSYDKYSAKGFVRLLDGRIDLYIDHPFDGFQGPFRATVNVHISRLPLVIEGSPVALMLSKKTVSLEQVRAINHALLAMRRDGTASRILQFYRKMYRARKNSSPKR